MLRVVFAKFETGQTFSPVQTDATLLAYNSLQLPTLLGVVAPVCTQPNTYHSSNFINKKGYNLIDFLLE